MRHLLLVGFVHLVDPRPALLGGGAVVEQWGDDEVQKDEQEEDEGQQLNPLFPRQASKAAQSLWER